MKTPMQELINELYFIEGLKDEIDISQKSIFKTAAIKNALEKEKEQMIDFAFNLYNALSDLNQVPKNLVTENNNIVKRYFEHIFSDQDKYFEQAVESNKKQQNK